MRSEPSTPAAGVSVGLIYFCFRTKYLRGYKFVFIHTQSDALGTFHSGCWRFRRADFVFKDKGEKEGRREGGKEGARAGGRDDSAPAFLFLSFF